MTSRSNDWQARKSIAEKYKYALLLSACGDSLGWPNEGRGKPTQDDGGDFVTWKKRVGGRFWGYTDEIKKGEYSDDTQLTLAVARSFDAENRFVPEYFAYYELPLWLHYERGGGRAIKAAARNLLKKNVKWVSNFYNDKSVGYGTAGANGASMRTPPISLAAGNQVETLIIDCVKNAVITHGHARAIVGALTVALAQQYFLYEVFATVDQFVRFVSSGLKASFPLVEACDELAAWLKNRQAIKGFDEQYRQAVDETIGLMNGIDSALGSPDTDFYKSARAFDPERKGSGTGTAVVALFMAMQHMEEPARAIESTAFMRGSDTDTIASMVGSLMGLLHGENLVADHQITHWVRGVQDRGYLERVAVELLDRSDNKEGPVRSVPREKENALQAIFSWDMGLHEMFWNGLGEGESISHPTLGRGMLNGIDERPVAREGYVARVMRVSFDSGQTVYFHSRVSSEGTVSQSTSKDLAERVRSGIS